MIIGIDLGGTNLRIGAVTSDGQLQASAVTGSQAIAGARDPAGELCGIIADYVEKNRIQDIEAISIGVPSSVEADKETVICTTNIRKPGGRACLLSYEPGGKDTGAFSCAGFCE